jgi:hypothetical protein
MLSTKKNSALLLIIGSLLLSYSAVRAVLLAITWDEAYTYIEFARNGKILLDKYDMMSANNHILNTAGMIFFSKLFGLHEFALRIPSLFAHLIFLFYSGRLIAKCKNQWIGFFGFLIINLNPYMLDFFSLARGYGLSIAFMMSSIFHLYLFIEEGARIKNSVIAIVFAAVAVIANFVLLNYLVVLFGLIVLLNIYFLNEEKALGITTFFKNISLSLFVMIIFFCLITPMLLHLKEAGALFFGGHDGFWPDTVSTIVNRSFYEQPYSHYLIQRIVKAFIVVTILFGAFYSLSGLMKRKTWTKEGLFLLTIFALLILSSLSTIIQFHTLGTLYLIDRTVLFLFVLFSVFIVFQTDNLAELKGQVVYITGTIASLMVLHFIKCANLNYCLEWKYDGNTKEMLEDVNEMKKIPLGKETISIGIPLTFDPGINFYREKDQLTWLNSAWRSETNNPLHDFYYLTTSDVKEFNRDSIEVIKAYPVTGNILARPKYPVKELRPDYASMLDHSNSEKGFFKIDSTVEYAPGFTYKVNDSTTPQKRAIIAFYAEVKAPDLTNDNVVMVLSFQGSKGELYSWQKAYAKDFLRNETDWFRINFTCIVPPAAKAGDEIKAYLWNPDKHQLNIKKQEFKWLSYYPIAERK